MTEGQSVVPFPNRHGQPGYFSLAELPQRPSIAAHAISTGWWELDQIFKFYRGQFVVCTGIQATESLHFC